MTTTYTHKLKRSSSKVSKSAPASSSEKPAPQHTSQIHVKTYDPISGACFRITISRVNELGRVMSALGPRGTTSSITDQSDSSTVKEKHVQGLAAAMLGFEDDTGVTETESAASAPAKADSESENEEGTATPVSAGTKSKKKNNKKR